MQPPFCLPLGDWLRSSTVQACHPTQAFWPLSVPTHRSKRCDYCATKVLISPPPLTDDTNLRVVGMPSSVLTERQPTVAPSDQIKESKKYLRLWRASHDLTFNYDVGSWKQMQRYLMPNTNNHAIHFLPLQGSHMIAYSGKVLYVYDFVTDKSNRFANWLVDQFTIISPLRYISDLPIQCLAVHPTRNCIATGTSIGKIVLW